MSDNKGSQTSVWKIGISTLDYATPTTQAQERINDDSSFYVPDADTKGAWVGHFLPPGTEVPELPQNPVVPYDFYTEEERELMRTAKKSDERQLKFWNWDFYASKWEEFCHWIHEAFYDWYSYSPICFGRSWDFKDSKINLANKLYIQERGNLSTKTRIWNCYERAQYAVLQSLIYKRAYMNHDDFRYVYKTSFPKLEDQLVFDHEEITKLRNIFLKYDPEFKGYVSFQNMCKVLDEFGIKSSQTIRRTEFKKYVNLINVEEPSWGSNIEFEQFLCVADKLQRAIQKEKDQRKFIKVNPVQVRERAKSSLRNNPHYAGPSSLSQKLSLGLF